MVIKKEDGKYCLYSKDGTKKLGCHSSREAAMKQERAVQASKQRNMESIDQLRKRIDEL